MGHVTSEVSGQPSTGLFRGVDVIGDRMDNPFRFFWDRRKFQVHPGHSTKGTPNLAIRHGYTVRVRACRREGLALLTAPRGCGRHSSARSTYNNVASNVTRRGPQKTTPVAQWVFRGLDDRSDQLGWQAWQAGKQDKLWAVKPSPHVS